MFSSHSSLSPTSAGEEPQPAPLPPLLAVRPLSSDWSSALSARFTLTLPTSPAPFPASARAALVYTHSPVDAGFFDLYPAVECIVTTSAGVSHIDMEECRRRGVQVANMGEIFSVDVADYAVGLLIDVLRRITMADRHVRDGMWNTRGSYPLGTKLGGKRVGIVGLGSIGSAIAKRLDAFGCTIYYSSRRPKSTFNYKYIPNIYDLATESDILVISCSLTKETHHIINKRVLLALGTEGIIVNIGRGANIDEVELIRCLVRGEIKGVGLDVYENEPNVPEEFIEMESAVLTPHCAVFTDEARSDCVQACIANFEAFFAGKPLITPVVAD